MRFACRVHPWVHRVGINTIFGVVRRCGAPEGAPYDFAFVTTTAKLLGTGFGDHNVHAKPCFDCLLLFP
jgi:hypothetical protein